MTARTLRQKKVDLKEQRRLQTLTQLESAARRAGYRLIAGIDEAGRGPLAGPVVAAACILPDNLFIPGINDSKQLTALERERIYDILTQDHRVLCGVGIIHSDQIDQLNIYQATIHAMKHAIGELVQLPDYMLVDGMKLPNCSIPHSKEIKGDARSQSIAAASIIAKVTRDRLMIEYHERWPVYGFDRHKGYGTAAHIEAIHTHGPCSIHRMSFEPMKSLVLV